MAIQVLHNCKLCDTMCIWISCITGHVHTKSDTIFESRARKNRKGYGDKKTGENPLIYQEKRPRKEHAFLILSETATFLSRLKPAAMRRKHTTTQSYLVIFNCRSRTMHLSVILPLHARDRLNPHHFSSEVRMVCRFHHFGHVFIRPRCFFGDPGI
jgi:hypothetical protein